MLRSHSIIKNIKSIPSTFMSKRYLSNDDHGKYSLTMRIYEHISSVMKLADYDKTECLRLLKISDSEFYGIVKILKKNGYVIKFKERRGTFK